MSGEAQRQEPVVAEDLSCATRKQNMVRKWDLAIKT